MNYYARAIEIIASGRMDWFEIVVRIAAKHPKAVVLAAHEGEGWRKEEDWRKEVKALVDSGNMLDAIKLCRACTGYSLKEAKNEVDRLATQR